MLSFVEERDRIFERWYSARWGQVPRTWGLFMTNAENLTGMRNQRLSRQAHAQEIAARALFSGLLTGCKGACRSSGRDVIRRFGLNMSTARRRANIWDQGCICPRAQYHTSNTGRPFCKLGDYRS